MSAAATLPALAGCGDPAGPSVSGSISLGTNVHAADFATLQIRAYPDPAGAFDPTHIPSGASSDVEPSSVAFPFHYRVGEPLGTTPSANWHLVAWLSHHAEADGTTVAPEHGDVLCAVPVRIASCGSYGDYCGETRGVDCTLDTVAP